MRRRNHMWPRTTPYKRDLRQAALRAWLRARAERGKPDVYPDKAVVGNRLVKLYYRGEFLGLWTVGNPGRMTWTEPRKPILSILKIDHSPKASRKGGDWL